MLAMGEWRGGGRKKLWLDLVKATMQAWEIDPAEAEGMTYAAFKAGVKKQLLGTQAAALAKEERDSSVLKHYKQEYGGNVLQFSRVQTYLSGGPCGKGKELVLQLRAGSLPIAGLTGKFGRSRRDDANDPAAFRCPACNTAKETQGHFILECPKYREERSEMMRRLKESVTAAAWTSFEAMAVEEKACAVVDFDRRYECAAVSHIVAPFMTRCWEIRKDCIAASSSALGRVVYGTDAETE
jgi:hypothetical protein